MAVTADVARQELERRMQGGTLGGAHSPLAKPPRDPSDSTSIATMSLLEETLKQAEVELARCTNENNYYNARIADLEAVIEAVTAARNRLMALDAHPQQNTTSAGIR